MKHLVAISRAKLAELRNHRCGDYTALTLLLGIMVAVHVLAYGLRFEGEFSQHAFDQLVVTLPLVVAIKMIAAYRFGMHRDFGRLINFGNLVTLVQATTVGTLCALVALFLFAPATHLPRSVFVLDWLLTIAAVGGARSLIRFFTERRPLRFFATSASPCLIVGVGESGEAVLRAIRRDARSAFKVVGFISEEPGSLNRTIDGVPIVGLLHDTCSLAVQHGVSQVFITHGDLSGHQVRWLMNSAELSGVNVSVLPSFEQLLSGDVDLRPREVSIEDLLCREPVKLDCQGLHQWLAGRTVLVTGSAGSIGSELCRQILAFSPGRLVLVDQSENGQFFLERELKRLSPDCDLLTCVGDITDRQRMDRIFAEHRPTVIFHAAAYKHVPLMEANVSEAIKNIPLATRVLADLAQQHDVESFVMVSTDKAVNPTSVMGACKRAAEQYVQALSAESACRFVTVRFGNVLDSAGSVVPIFRNQIARGGPVTVTHPEMQRYFMTIPEAAQLIVQAGALGNGGEIFVLDMGEPVKIVDLARDMIRLSGLREAIDIDIEFVGTRPGEKLFEELYGQKERYGSTLHPKILVANCHVDDYLLVRRQLDRLAASVQQTEQSQLASLQALVPEFQRQGNLGSRVLRHKAA